MLLLLHGPDSFRLHERYQVLRQAFIEKYDPQQLNLVNIDIVNSDGSTIHQHLSQPGLFVQKRFIGVRGLEQLKVALAKNITADLTTLPADTIVVCMIADIQKVTEAVRALLLEQAKVEEFVELQPAQVGRWLKQRADAAGVRLTIPALAALTAAVGSDLWLANNVLQQLAQLQQTITPELVQQYIASPVDDNIFHLTDAIAQKNTQAAIRLLHDQWHSGTTAGYIISLLARQMVLLFQVKEAPTQVQAHAYVLQKAKQHAQRFSLDQLRQLQGQLLELDWTMKHTTTDPTVLLDQWVVQACVPLTRVTRQ